MAIEYSCGSAATLSEIAGRDLLIRELKLTVSKDSPLWIYNEGVGLMVYDYPATKLYEAEVKFAGFEPKWGMRMRPMLTKTAALLELGCRTMVRIADCIMRNTEEDVYLSYEWERLLIQRRNGVVCVRDDFAYDMSEEYLSELTMPFSMQKLKP